MLYQKNTATLAGNQLLLDRNIGTVILIFKVALWHDSVHFYHKACSRYISEISRCMIQAIYLWWQPDWGALSKQGLHEWSCLLQAELHLWSAGIMWYDYLPVCFSLLPFFYFWFVCIFPLILFSFCLFLFLIWLISTCISKMAKPELCMLKTLLTSLLQCMCESGFTDEALIPRWTSPSNLWIAWACFDSMPKVLLRVQATLAMTVSRL